MEHCLYVCIYIYLFAYIYTYFFFPLAFMMFAALLALLDVTVSSTHIGRFFSFRAVQRMALVHANAWSKS